MTLTSVHGKRSFISQLIYPPQAMNDLIYLGVALAFFLIAALYAKSCDTL